MQAKIVSKFRREAVDIACIRDRDVIILETIPGYDWERQCYRDPDTVKTETAAALARWKKGLGL